MDADVPAARRVNSPPVRTQSLKRHWRDDNAASNALRLERCGGGGSGTRVRAVTYWVWVACWIS